MTKLVPEVTIDGIVQWFCQFGIPTDYLRAHYRRFQQTKAFALSNGSNFPLTILDIGAHWLHETFFYANDGHRLMCVDNRITLKEESVKRAAAAMQAELIECPDLEMGDGIAAIGESSIDLVLFCEVIEHLAFNPILMWKQIYRVLRSGGCVILTTPNANFWRRVDMALNRMQAGGGIGIKVEEIMEAGTHGHHWKEYTLKELERYFAYLSSDFVISRTNFSNTQVWPPMPADMASKFPFGEEIKFDNIGLEISLPEKGHGITVSPPWIIPRGAHKRPAFLCASPNPVPAGKGPGKTTVSWDTADERIGKIYVSVNGGQELLFAHGRCGSALARWIQIGSTYEFRLYDADHTELLAKVYVTRIMH